MSGDAESCFLFRMFVLFVYGLYVSRSRSFVPGGERDRAGKMNHLLFLE